MFKNLFNKLFKKITPAKVKVATPVAKDSIAPIEPKLVVAPEQPKPSLVAVAPQSFEEEYQQAFYSYLFGSSSDLHCFKNDELAEFTLDKIERLLSSPKLILDSLPILPMSLAKVIDQLNNKDFDTDGLVASIQQEPAIAAKVIELANSAYYNRNNREISDLKSAFMVLGTKGLSEGVINGFVNKMVPQSSIYFKQYGKKIWQHSLSTGVIAKALVASSAQKESAAHAYFIGLICNLGDVIIYQLMVDAFSVVHPDYQPNSTLFKSVMAKNSKRLTYFIAKYWNFPNSILEVLALQAKVKKSALLPALHKKMPIACFVYEAQLLSELEMRLTQETFENDYIEEVSNSLLYTQEAKKHLTLMVAEKKLASCK